MCSAQNKKYIKKVATPLLGVAFLFMATNSIKAGNVQVCSPSSTCTVGEYLYDDSYQPEVGASCVLNIKNTDGTSFLSNQSLTATSDAWYGHTFTSSSTVGYYRAEICCDISADHMCIDKSFEVKNDASGSGSSADDIASAVWNYSGRTLTGFNNIVADVWSYATRTLTSGANITNVTNITTTDIQTIKETTAETRNVLEQLINKPIVENSLEEIKDFDLGDRIKQSKTTTNELFINLQFVGSVLDKTNKNWDKLTDRQILDNLNEVKDILGDESDSSSTDSFFGRVNFLRDTWKSKDSDDLHEEAKALKEGITFVTTGVASYGKSKSLQKELASVLSYFKSSEKSLDLVNKNISNIEAVGNVVDANLSDIDSILKNWDDVTYLSVKSQVDEITKNLVTINKLPKLQVVLDSSYPDIVGSKKVKNKIFSLRALFFANKRLLLGGDKLAFSASWLEEGSVVIKTLITNPSTLISQEVPVKYYLPKELKKENVIDIDAGAEVKYDTEKDQLFVEGTFTLKPGETRTIRVRLEDIWVISESEIDSLKNQASELVKPLAKTAYYAQGITIKSDIDVSLEKARSLIADGQTPESKIKTYREAELELVSAKEKIEKLKDMVAEASNSGSILGFVGGSQAIAVWGIVVAVVAGFVFMTVYMRKLLNPEKVVVKSKRSSGGFFDKLAVFLVVATVSGLISSIGVKKIVLPVQAKSVGAEQVLGSSIDNYLELRVVKLQSESGVVNLYQNSSSPVVLEILDSGSLAIELDRVGDRVKVVLNQREVWVDSDNVLNI